MQSLLKTHLYMAHLQDMRTLRFAHKQETHSRRGMYDRLQIVSFPTSYGKNVFAYAFAGEYQENGWEVYNATKELERLVRRGERERETERVGKAGWKGERR